MNMDKPWDAKLAYCAVYPLRHTWVTPNHITCLRMLFGIFACIAFAKGGAYGTNLGAIFFVISNFLDHADGELARITGKMSRRGHYFDLICDALVSSLLFISIGIGLSYGESGNWSVFMGWFAGISVIATFLMRNEIEERAGKTVAQQPHAGGFEAEDVLYLLPAVTILDGLLPFLFVACIGTPIFALWILNKYLILLNKNENPYHRC